MNLISRLAATGLLLLAWSLPADAYLFSRDGSYNNISGLGPPAPWIQVLLSTGGLINSGSPTVLTSSADIPIGSTIAMAVNTPTVNQDILTCTDNATVGGSPNTYVVSRSAPTAGVASAAICYVVNSTRDIPPGSVWTVTTGAAQYNVRGVWYITGYNGGLDKSASVNQATPGTAVAGVATTTLSNAADQAIGFAYVNAGASGLITESPLFTNLFNNNFNTIGYDTVTSTAALSYAPTWSGASAYSAVLLAFLPTGAGGGCAQATTLNAKLDGGQNTSAVTNAVCGLVTDGVWSKLDALYVYAINSATNARLNWVSTSFNLTINGTCTFTANAGYTGNGTNCYQATGFTPSTAGGQWTLNSASIGNCVLTSRTTGSFHYMMGTNSDLVSQTTWAAIGDAIGSTAVSYGVNGGFVNATQTNVQGTWMASRTTSVLTTFYHNGTSASSTSQVSGSLSANPLVLMALNSTSISNFNPDQFAYFFYGAGLTATDIANLNNRMHTYLSAVGAPAGC